MRKVFLAAVVLAALLCLILVLRPRRSPGPDAPASEGVESVPAIRRASTPGFHPARPRTGLTARPSFNSTIVAPAVVAEPAQPADEGLKPPPPAYRARDHYYDRLLLQQGRDQAKEEQVLSRVMTVFADSPDTLVGAIACSAEFCRIDLRAVGEVDVNKRWQDDLFSAVEPKGLKFFVVANDDDGNTLTSFYFGRDKSWTVPDFHALGLL